MRKPTAAALLLFVLVLLCAPCLEAGETNRPASEGADATGASTFEDRGAGYLPYSDPQPLGSGGFFGAIIRTVFSLAIVIGLLYATLWVIRKFTGSTAGESAEGSIRVVGRVYLSPKVVVYFLKVVDRLLVVGTNAGSISLLTTIEDEYEALQIENALKQSQLPGAGLPFSRLFDKSMARFQKALDREDSRFDDQLRTLNDQIGRLRGLARKRRSDED